VLVPNGKRKVLLVDDAPLIADTLAKIFVHAGFESRAVYSAEAAIELLETQEWVPALAIIDVHLPGMNGVDLAILLSGKYPDMRLSLLSGHALTTHLIEEAQRKGYTFEVVAKPTHPSVFLTLAASIPSTDEPSMQ
jgi:DNA-binding NtrC family response regulator